MDARDEEPVILQKEQDESHLAEKVDAIRRACDLGDLDALVSHARSEGGFLRDDLRQLAWPILLRCQQARRDDDKDWNELPRHADEDQVQLDVHRSFVYYPSGTDEELSKKKDELSNVITNVLRNYPYLCYFQGYHDIVQVLLLVLGEKQAAPAVTQISLFRIRDYMLPSLKPSLKHLQIIPAIIERADPGLRQHLSDVRPFFALAATLTLYAHDIQEYSDIARLFDFLLAHEPVVPIYLFAAIILSRKKELLEIPVDEPEMMHFTLSKLPSPLDLDGLIQSAVQLFNDYPPESLPFGVWKQIPACSVLKSSRDPFREQTAKNAVKLFDQQTRQLRNDELRKKALGLLWTHRKAIGSVVVAVFVGAVSIWIRKKGFDASIWSYMGNFKAAFEDRFF
ncbi:TBC domain-containing protein [Aspergillus glaucus CBS 516.65]|uniref:Rab-GAP TBC domain-containing protein n=1 Tax=Aspergillus glaucus CBS 516.65 TaxID=1160497 RepID=A0A1L9VRE8_ASPGL|nr:hypothetical protein ASPGLDRAFT_120795 [Aspergillus glaucus CBS 516.65]OJJ86464.1 hypothetical protein ASPGLDRAFT_120795 [Aspergillus glaucus CBS 516.65]